MRQLMTKKWPPCCCCYTSFHHLLGEQGLPKLVHLMQLRDLWYFISHVAVWKSMSASSWVDSYISLWLGVRKARLTASTSPWISISLYARKTAPLGHLMNFSKHILCLCLTMLH